MIAHSINLTGDLKRIIIKGHKLWFSGEVFMKDHSELNRYMNRGIKDIILNALKASLKNPQEIKFLLRFVTDTANARRIRMRHEAMGLHVPPFLIASIASDCNLFCKGCYARANQSCDSSGCPKPPFTTNALLTEGHWDRIFTEAAALGISFILLAGGEPLMRKEVLEKAADHPQILFPVFTNGTLVNDSWITFFRKKRNLVPIFSLEGDEEETDLRRGHGVYQKATEAMACLKEKSVPFGVSITVTSQNIRRVTEYEFVRALQQTGCSIVFFVEYVPVTAETKSLAPTDADRALMDRRISKLRTLSGCPNLLSFPGDEKHSGGCLAAGRGFFHINPFGGAEPCPFSPISDSNVRDCPLKEVLASGLFRSLEESGMLALEHEGGCALFGKDSKIMEMMASG